jgi:hypothetical protein
MKYTYNLAYEMNKNLPENMVKTAKSQNLEIIMSSLNKAAEHLEVLELYKQAGIVTNVMEHLTKKI